MIPSFNVRIFQMKKVGVIDTGTGNLGSLTNALGKVNAKFHLIKTKENLEKFDKVILPGVGSARGILDGIKKRGLFSSIKNFLEEARLGRKKFLGICLGLQILFKKTQEDDSECFSIFDIGVEKFPSTKKVPHMGWNSLICNKENPLFQGISEIELFYFVHSYFAPIFTATTHACDYDGIKFSAAISVGDIYAVQFHPEKSAESGLKVLRNFISL